MRNWVRFNEIGQISPQCETGIKTWVKNYSKLMGKYIH